MSLFCNIKLLSTLLCLSLSSFFIVVTNFYTMNMNHMNHFTLPFFKVSILPPENVSFENKSVKLFGYKEWTEYWMFKFLIVFWFKLLIVWSMVYFLERILQNQGFYIILRKENMFSLLSFSKAQCFISFALVLLVSHWCCTGVALMLLVSHLCRLCRTRVAFILKLCTILRNFTQKSD